MIERVAVMDEKPLCLLVRGEEKPADLAIGEGRGLIRMLIALDDVLAEEDVDSVAAEADRAEASISPACRA